MKVLAENLRMSPFSPRWKLYFKTFPACISATNRWSPDEEISISFYATEDLIEQDEGTIYITFLNDPSGKIRQFLHEWREGLWNTKTGTQASWTTWRQISKSEMKTRSSQRKIYFWTFRGT